MTIEYWIAFIIYAVILSICCALIIYKDIRKARRCSKELELHTKRTIKDIENMNVEEDG